MDPPSQPVTRPFAILLEREEEAGGRFRPGASVAIGPALRTTGFLREVSGDDLKDLLLLLTFAGPEGNVLPALPQLAEATGLPQVLARARMRRLVRSAWQGRPLVTEVRRESGLDAFAPSPHLLDVRPSLPSRPAAAPPIRAAGRDAVVSHSRETYARPRAEVEAEIARVNGWDLSPKEKEDVSQEGQERAALRRRMLAAGVSREQAGFLLTQFDAGRIGRQLDWLPYRNARLPASFLVAALSGDYGPPAALRSTSTSPDPSPHAHPPSTN